MGRGGSEAAALWGIQSLWEDYDVTLLTAGHVGPSQLDDLNRFYGTSLNRDHFRMLEAPVLPGMRNNQSAAALRGSLFQRFCRNVAAQFDVLVNAYNLCDFGVPAIHLIADLSWAPELRQQFDPMPASAQRMIHRDGPLRRAYLRLARWLAKPSGRNLFGGEDLLVVNSHWTARILAERYGVPNAPVLYPPVAAEFPAVSFDKRELGFVCIGRIAHEKRIEDVVEILRRVRELGHDVHLHVIGVVDGSPYGRMVRRLCQAHSSWVSLDGQKVGDQKASLLARHRFGIHGRPHEAFGISVAEMVKAGCIPFVPDTGGQVEIVDEPSLCYHDVDDAVAKIDTVLSSDPLQRRFAAALADRAGRFSPAQFGSKFRAIVDEFSASFPGSPRPAG